MHYEGMAIPPHLQRHIAWASVAPTTLRGMLDKGGRRIVCDYLANLELSDVNADNFVRFLNVSTSALKSRLGERRWGPARKAMNLFMRDLSYNYWIRRELNLDKIEHLLELPLDSKTMGQIAKCTDDRKLRPVSVVNLDEIKSQNFQDAAFRIAEAEGLARIHLDLRWWSENQTS